MHQLIVRIGNYCRIIHRNLLFLAFHRCFFLSQEFLQRTLPFHPIFIVEAYSVRIKVMLAHRVTQYLLIRVACRNFRVWSLKRVIKSIWCRWIMITVTIVLLSFWLSFIFYLTSHRIICGFSLYWKNPLLLLRKHLPYALVN